MTCPRCHSSQTSPLSGTTDLGYQAFCCRACRRKLNERTGTPFNPLEFPTDIIFQVLFCRFRYKLSFRNVAELFLGERKFPGASENAIDVGAIRTCFLLPIGQR